jgi:hypothetical protein
MLACLPDSTPPPHPPTQSPKHTHTHTQHNITTTGSCRRLPTSSRRCPPSRPTSPAPNSRCVCKRVGLRVHGSMGGGCGCGCGGGCVCGHLCECVGAQCVSACLSAPPAPVLSLYIRLWPISLHVECTAATHIPLRPYIHTQTSYIRTSLSPSFVPSSTNSPCRSTPARRPSSPCPSPRPKDCVFVEAAYIDG